MDNLLFDLDIAFRLQRHEWWSDAETLDLFVRKTTLKTTAAIRHMDDEQFEVYVRTRGITRSETLDDDVKKNNVAALRLWEQYMIDAGDDSQYLRRVSGSRLSEMSANFASVEGVEHIQLPRRFRDPTGFGSTSVSCELREIYEAYTSKHWFKTSIDDSGMSRLEAIRYMQDVDIDIHVITSDDMLDYCARSPFYRITLDDEADMDLNDAIERLMTIRCVPDYLLMYVDDDDLFMSALPYVHGGGLAANILLRMLQIGTSDDEMFVDRRVLEVMEGLDVTLHDLLCDYDDHDGYEDEDLEPLAEWMTKYITFDEAMLSLSVATVYKSIHPDAEMSLETFKRCCNVYHLDDLCNYITLTEELLDYVLDFSDYNNLTSHGGAKYLRRNKIWFNERQQVIIKFMTGQMPEGDLMRHVDVRLALTRPTFTQGLQYFIDRGLTVPFDTLNTSQHEGRNENAAMLINYDPTLLNMFTTVCRGSPQTLQQVMSHLK